MASFAANVTAAVLTLFSVPLYIGYVGIEAYALVGLFISMQVIFAVLDLGLSAAITRELAGEDLPLREKRDLLRTSEAIYWGTAVAGFSRTLELKPDFAYAHYYAALAHQRQRQLPRAAEHFDAFLRLAPEAPERSAVLAIMRTLK